jgi:hypothetical protein
MIQPLIDKALADGYEILQEGRVLVPFDPKAKQKPRFSDRVEGCNVSLIRSGDKLLDDDERWAHLRRRDG